MGNKKIETLKNIPVVICSTSMHLNENKAKAKDLGAMYFFRKYAFFQ